MKEMAMLNVGFIVERRYLRQEMTAAVTRAFHMHGVNLDLICPQDCHFEPETGILRGDHGLIYNLNHYDVIVPRIRNALGLALLSYASSAGITVINSYQSILRARNKTEVAVALGQAGIPCAPTILTDDAAVLGRLPKHWYPLILKAVYGDNSQGLRLVRKPEDLDIIRWSDELVLAQHYIANDGFDLKLYACGGQVFATRKPSPFNVDPNVSLIPVQPDQRMINLTLRVGEVLGLQIYGVDAIETPEGPAIIEVNEFPNFTGIPGAPGLIAEYITKQLDTMRSFPHAHRLHYATVGV
jgi:ribosomal protein S6--L-glutamate ligase